MEIVNMILTYVAFPLKLYLGLPFFSAFLEKRDHFLWRLVAGILFSFGLCALTTYLCGETMIYLPSLLTIFYVFGAIFFAYRMPFCQLSYLTSILLSLQQVPYNIITLIFLIFFGDLYDETGVFTIPWLSFLMQMLQIISTVFTYYLFYRFVLDKRKFPIDVLKRNRQSIFIGMVLIFSNFILFQVAYVLQFGLFLENGMSVVHGQYVFEFLFAISTITCLFAIGYLVNLLKKEEADVDIKTMEEAIRKMADQHAHFKENIDIINRKCHDMKYLLSAFQGQDGLAKSPSGKKYLSELQEALDIYGSTPKTGNALLDSLLAENILRCHQRQIDFSCLADGKLIDFLEDTAVYTLFGNALSNAIEATEKIDAEKRYIHLDIHQTMKDWVSIALENSYDGSKVQEGVTSKEDKDSHGFGLRSIRFIVEKYHGGMEIHAKDNVFHLDILLPVPNPVSDSSKSVD